MADTPLPRPRQVSFSGWSIIAGSVLTILYAFQRVSLLGSLESQQSVLDFVSTSPGKGLGLSVDEVQTAIRLMCLVAGGTAAATAILGWYVMAPSRSARVVLSVLAPVLFVAGLTSGGLFSALVAAGVAMLWVQPARDYFNGKAPVRDAVGAAAMSGGTSPWSAPTGGTRVPPPPPGGSAWDLTRPGGEAAASTTAPGTTSTDSGSAQPAPSPYGVPATPGPQRRPGTVTAAVITTIVASTITCAGLVVSLLYIASNRAEFRTQIDAQLATSPAYDEFSSSTLADISIGVLAVLALWCLVAIGLAIGTARASNGARIALVVSASLSGLVSLLGALVVVPLLLTIASIATVVLLFRGGASEWFAARRRR